MKIDDHKHPNESLENCRKVLPQVLNISKHDVRYEGMHEGCIVLVFLIPLSSVVDLMTLALNYDHQLIDMGVIGVHLQEDDYIPLDDRASHVGIDFRHGSPTYGAEQRFFVEKKF